MESHREHQFGAIIGNQFTKSLIQGHLSLGTLRNSIAFYGLSGLGKSYLAEVTALAVTCPNFKEEPCLVCDVCKSNLKALQSNTSNDYISKINIAGLDKKELLDKVKYIFKLRPKLGTNCVYILEELDILNADEQKIFLEELSNIPKGVYIFLCTSRYWKLSPDTKRRFTPFEMKTPKIGECLELVENYCDDKGIQYEEQVARFLIKHSSNNPSLIYETLDLLTLDNTLDSSRVREFLGRVDTSKYLDFLQACKQDMFNFVQYLDELKSDDISIFYRGLKEFFIDLMFTVYGKTKLSFNTEDTKRVKELFNDIPLDKFYALLDYIRVSVKESEDDIYYTLVGLKRILTDSTPKKIISSSVKEATKNDIISQKKYTETTQSSSSKDTTLNESKMLEILGSIKKLKD